MMDILDIKKHKTIIVDLGCGKTYDGFGSPLCEKWYNKHMCYLGFDIDKNHITKLKRKFGKKINRNHYYFQVLDIINNPLPLDDDSIDEIHCHMLQPNIEFQQPKGFELQLFQEVHRILKEGKKFYFSCDSSFFRRNSNEVTNEDYDLLIEEMGNIFDENNVRIKFNLAVDKKDKYVCMVRKELENYTHYPRNTRFYAVCGKS